MSWRRSIGSCLVVVMAFNLLGSPAVLAAGPLRNYAIVQSDGSMRVQGRTIRLFGVHLPRTGRDCDARVLPATCGSRAALALKRKIQGFVTCYPQGRYRDRSISAVCYVDQGSIADPPLDLGAWLIEQGLAVAGPDAPFEYVTLERIAEARGRGIWRDFFD